MQFTRRKFIEGIAGGTGLVLSGCGGSSPSQSTVTPSEPPPAVRPNVIMICVDDLNDWVGCLGGHPQASTPNIDALASRGVLFNNAHCNAPICYPSRTSALTGQLPTALGIYHNSDSPFRDVYPDIETLPQTFKKNGYVTFGSGRFFHDADPVSWDSYWPALDRHIAGDPVIDNLPLNGLDSIGNLDWGAVSTPLEQMGDHRMVSGWAQEVLAAEYDDPFFMAVGFYKPHLPWFLPTAYMERFSPDSTLLPETMAGDVDDLPPIPHRWATGVDDHQTIADAGMWDDAVAAYLAAVSFADEMLGILLDSIQASSHAENSIIVLWSDNGYHMGEKTRWRKNTLWHEATRVPMIIADPRGLNNGLECSRPVALVDLYPTLAELCGLENAPELDGTSLVPLLDDPDAARDVPALVTRGFYNNAVITESWRYILYRDSGAELYDLTADGNEWANLAGRPEFADVEESLAAWIPETQIDPV